MDTIDTIGYKGYKINVHPDFYPQNPRTEWDNLATLTCWHRRYDLGDKHRYENPADMFRELAELADPEVTRKLEYWENGDGFDRLLKKHGNGAYDVCDEITEKIIAKTVEKNYIMLNLYLYDHSNLYLRASDGNPFYDAGLPQGHAYFDSGLVGYVYVSKAAVLEETGSKRFDKKSREYAMRILKSETEVYANYLSGNVYGYTVIKDDEEEVLASCWGYYGDYEKDMLWEARGEVDRLAAKEGKLEVLRLGVTSA